jgi:hypothetical protein
MVVAARLFALLAGIMLVLGIIFSSTGPIATSQDSNGSDGAAAPYGIVTDPIPCASPWSMWTNPGESASQNGACLDLTDSRADEAKVYLFYATLALGCSALCFLLRRTRRPAGTVRPTAVPPAGQSL